VLFLRLRAAELSVFRAGGYHLPAPIRTPENHMKSMLCAMFAVSAGLASIATGDEPKAPAHGADMPEAVFKNFKDLKWDRMLPALGEASPEICILHVDPKTKATKLLIRTPKGIHVRKHWHSANETHMMIAGTAVFACDGRRIEQGPGSFNFLPAKMVHEAWTSAGSVVFITVDGPWDVNWTDGAPGAADLVK